MENLTPKQEKEAIRMQKENYKAQIDAYKAEYKNNARKIALREVSDYKVNSEGNEEIMTAKEKIADAEIIYKWLIKDL